MDMDALSTPQRPLEIPHSPRLRPEIVNNASMTPLAMGNQSNESNVMESKKAVSIHVSSQEQMDSRNQPSSLTFEESMLSNSTKRIT